MPPVAFPDRERPSQPPHIVVVIPARYQSSRFPGKPLAEIEGRSMIEHVYRRAAAAPGVGGVVVATDDARIARTVERFGGTVQMTEATHRTGMDRIAEVAATLTCDIVVNVQGDEPLIDPGVITQMIEPLRHDQHVEMTTVRRAITSVDDYHDPHVVKVVTDREGNALYFSRSPIPFIRAAVPQGGPGALVSGTPIGASRGVYKHLGLYAYRRPFLLRVAGLPQTPLEIAESLEQLRVLEHGFTIRAVETQYDSIGVDTPADLDRVRQLMAGTHA